MTESSFVLDVAEEFDPDKNSPNWEIRPGDVTRGFHEGREYRIRKPIVSSQLLIDDQSLEGEDGYWIWSPGFYAGQVRAELLVHDGQVVATYVLDVSPHPGKLGRDIFQAMLDEIWNFDPRLVLGTEPPQSRVGHQTQVADPWLEYARLRSHGDKFIRALGAIARHPIRELRAERALLPLQYVRRADRQTALAAVRIPPLLAVLAGHDSTLPLTKTMPLFDVPVTQETLDAAANRCIAMITQAVARRAIQLKKTLELATDCEIQSDTRSDLASRWPRRRAFLGGLVRQLRQAQCVSPIRDVTRLEISAAGLNAVSADPTYSRAYGLAWRILRHGVEGPPDGEQMWICPTWEIYERWCFVRMGEALQAHRPQYRWSILTSHKSNATVALAAFKGNDLCIELLLQPQFPAGDANPKSGFRSVSGRREPDIVMIFREGKRRRWYVLDAKYRTTRSNVLDAMSSSHVYRDALRWHQKKPKSAVLLVPQSGGAPWMEQPDFIRAHQVGVCALSTDTDIGGLLDNLTAGDFRRTEFGKPVSNND